MPACIPFFREGSYSSSSCVYIPRKSPKEEKKKAHRLHRLPLSLLHHIMDDTVLSRPFSSCCCGRAAKPPQLQTGTQRTCLIDLPPTRSGSPLTRFWSRLVHADLAMHATLAALCSGRDSCMLTSRCMLLWLRSAPYPALCPCEPLGPVGDMQAVSYGARSRQ